MLNVCVVLIRKYSKFYHGNNMENITQAMNNILLEEEEEGGIAIEGSKAQENTDNEYVCNARLCLVGRFLTDGVLDFQAMQQTMAALWRPGRGVYIRELGVNHFLFQFYHEIDINGVVEGSPWTFNRKVLIIARMEKGLNPRCIPLNNIDLWVQVYDLYPGVMSEKVLKEVGNQIGVFVSSCPSNFKGVWREYMRIRVTIDLSKPLKRRMKLRKSGNEWSWINFKYENVPLFCFICGVLGHGEKICNQLFEKAESEITRPYGVWMRAPLRRQNKLIGARWLRNGREEAQASMETEEIRQEQNPEDWGSGVNHNTTIKGGKIAGDNSAVLNSKNLILGDKSGVGVGRKNKIIILENKKRRTESGQVVGLNTELAVDSDDEEIIGMEQDGATVSKNVQEAGSAERARLAL